MHTLINLTLKKKKKKKKRFVKPWGYDSPTKTFGLWQICCCCWWRRRRRRRIKEDFPTTSRIGRICEENGWESATTPIQEANKRKEPKEREIELPTGYSNTHADKRSMKLWKATNIWNFLEDPPLYKSCKNIFSYFLITC